MKEEEIYIMGVVTIVWIFASVIVLFEKSNKVNTKSNSDLEKSNKNKSTELKRNFRTVDPDSRKFFNNLVNDDGTPYVNEDFSCSKS